MFKLRIKYLKIGVIYRNKTTVVLDGGYVPHNLNHINKCNNYFKPPIKKNKPYTLVLPPPNITGSLHLGHALTATIQDVIVRWKQMEGFETVWVPGVDHAGIATQLIVEKLLWNECKKTKHDIGREEFIKRVEKWGNEKNRVIEEQLKQLGLLLNWDKRVYTLDKVRSEAVSEAFIRLFNAGLIYRADSLVNWSCVLKSAISDVEVEQFDIKGATNITVPGYKKAVEFGVLYKFAYRLDGLDDEIVVSTTRPETILGDVAVAVHPDDERYSKYIGLSVKHAFNDCTVPVIADDFVDKGFGTGAVKITPAHDYNDFRVGRKHFLKTVQVIDENGYLTNECGKYSGLPRFEAREKIINDLSSMGLLRGKEEHSMSVPLCSRSKDVVEYLIQPQWFVKCDTLAENAIKLVRDNKLNIIPKNLEKIWFNWLENIRDWCISRQLWWGHQIPAYNCINLDTKENAWIAAKSQEEAVLKASRALRTPASNLLVQQDEDVLDTWFSSALHPFASFGWPGENDDLNKYYPLSLMETGHDILFFWVARMVMLGSYLTETAPFDRVLLHGIVCDAHGRKMSKSLGNVVAPEDVIRGINLDDMRRNAVNNYESGIISKDEMERSIKGQKKMFPNGIPECGSDSLRFTLLSHNIKNHFINFDVNECYTNKLFCNKIWQATKFVQMWMNRTPLIEQIDFIALGVVDKWILSRLTNMVDRVREGLEQYDFYISTSALKNFLYYEFCDIYLEITKRGLRIGDATASCHIWCLLKSLDVSLRCLAPFMPVLSEHLYTHLPIYPGDVKSFYFPQKLDWCDLKAENDVKELMNIVVSVRRLKKVFNIGVKSGSKVYVVTKSDFISSHSYIIDDLTGFQDVKVYESATANLDGSNNVLKDDLSNATVYIQVPDEVKMSLRLDLDKTEKKIAKLQNELDKIRHTSNQSTKITSLEEQLGRLNYFVTIIKN